MAWALTVSFIGLGGGKRSTRLIFQQSRLKDTPSSDSSLTSTGQGYGIVTYASEVAIASVAAYDRVSRCCLSITNWPLLI